jgi:hypothetical protein
MSGEHIACCWRGNAELCLYLGAQSCVSFMKTRSALREQCTGTRGSGGSVHVSFVLHHDARCWRCAFHLQATAGSCLAYLCHLPASPRDFQSSVRPGVLPRPPRTAEKKKSARTDRSRKPPRRSRKTATKTCRTQCRVVLTSTRHVLLLCSRLPPVAHCHAFSCIPVLPHESRIGGDKHARDAIS